MFSSMTKPTFTFLMTFSLLANVVAQRIFTRTAHEKGYAVLDSISFKDIKRSGISGIGSFLKLILDTPINGKKPKKRYCKLYRNGEFLFLTSSNYVREFFEKTQERHWMDKTARSMYSLQTLYYCVDTAAQYDTVFMNIRFRGIGSVFQKREFEEAVADLTEGFPTNFNEPIHFPKHQYRAWVVDTSGEWWSGHFAAVNDYSVFLAVDSDERHEEVVEIPFGAIYTIGTRRKGTPALGLAVGITAVAITFTASSKRDPDTQKETVSGSVGLLMLGELLVPTLIGFKRYWHRIDGNPQRFKTWQRKKT